MNFLSSTDLNDLNLDPIDLPSPPLPRERHQKNNDENNMNLSNSPSPTQHTHKKPRTKKRRQSIVLPSEFITAQFPEVGEAIADSIAPTPSPVSSQTKGASTNGQTSIHESVRRFCDLQDKTSAEGIMLAIFVKAETSYSLLSTKQLQSPPSTSTSTFTNAKNPTLEEKQALLMSMAPAFKDMEVRKKMDNESVLVATGVIFERDPSTGGFCYKELCDNKPVSGEEYAKRYNKMLASRKLAMAMIDDEEENDEEENEEEEEEEDEEQGADVDELEKMDISDDYNVDMDENECDDSENSVEPFPPPPQTQTQAQTQKQFPIQIPTPTPIPLKLHGRRYSSPLVTTSPSSIINVDTSSSMEMTNSANVNSLGGRFTPSPPAMSTTATTATTATTTTKTKTTTTTTTTTALTKDEKIQIAEKEVRRQKVPNSVRNYCS